MGPIHSSSIRIIFEAAKEKVVAAKDAVGQKVSALGGVIKGFGESLKANFNDLRTHTWQNLSQRLPPELSKKLSNILIGVKIIPSFTAEELKSVSPRLMQKLTLDQIQSMNSEQLSIILPQLTSEQIKTLELDSILSKNLDLSTLIHLNNIFYDNDTKGTTLQLALLGHISDAIEAMDDEELNKFIQQPSHKFKEVLQYLENQPSDNSVKNKIEDVFNQIIRKSWENKVGTDVLTEIRPTDTHAIKEEIQEFATQELVKNKVIPGQKVYIESDNSDSEMRVLLGGAPLVQEFEKDVGRASKFVVNGEDIYQQRVKDGTLSGDQRLLNSAIQALSKASQGDPKMLERFQKVLHQGAIKTFFVPLFEKYGVFYQLPSENKESLPPSPKILAQIKEYSSDPNNDILSYEVDTTDENWVKITYSLNYGIQNSLKGGEMEPVNLFSQVEITMPRQSFIDGHFSNASVKLLERFERTDQNL